MSDNDGWWKKNMLSARFEDDDDDENIYHNYTDIIADIYT